MAEPETEKGPWLSGPVVCRVCGHKAVSVRPMSADQKSLQCSHCEGMTCEPDREEWGRWVAGGVVEPDTPEQRRAAIESAAGVLETPPLICHYSRLLSVEAARSCEDGRAVAIIYLDMEDAPKPGTLRLAVAAEDVPDLIEQLQIAQADLSDD